MGTLHDIRGKELYIEDLGDKTKPALLYLHGGPGTGSYDFVLHQGARLSEHVRLIAFDQRGVLRSAALTDTDDFGLMDLIEDCECVRHRLEIHQWSVLGHSFGGYLSLLYALTYPHSVVRLIFENATFDLGLSARSLLRGAAYEYGAIGETTKASACLSLAFMSPDTASPQRIWNDFTELTNGLGPRRNSLYVHSKEKNFFERLVETSSLPPGNWARGGMHQRKLFEEGEVFTSLLDEFGAVSHDTLLLKGKYDLVMSDDQIHCYLSAKPDTRMTVFEMSSHFIHVEEPDSFCSEVVQFLTRT